jgi:bacterioferritin-associated ferredoxin
MYICICNGITEGDIRTCVEQGASSMADLRRELGVATQCGRCESSARECLGDHSDTDAACALPA